MIGNHIVHCYLVDEDNSVSITYQDAFEAMNSYPKCLRPASTLLHGFIRESIYSEGGIDLVVTLGEAPRRTTTVVEFMVVKGRSAYKVIIERPILSRE